MAFSPQQVNGSSGWQWPQIRSVVDLLKAMRAGFEVCQLPDSSSFAIFWGRSRCEAALEEGYVVAAMRRDLVTFVGLKHADGSKPLALTHKAVGV